MTKRQLKRIALATEAHYILTGAGTDCVTDRLSEKDADRFQRAQYEVAYGWLRQAGFAVEPKSLDEIFEAVLGRKHAYDQ